MQKSKVLCIIAAFGLSACANTGASYRPIVDGPVSASFEADLTECQTVATQRDYLNGDVQSDAALGAGVGALVGIADSGDVGEMIGGALIGALVGGAARSWETQDERRQIVVNCMFQRGHKVVG